MSLKEIPGVLGVNCRVRNESEYNGLYCSLMGWLVFDLNGWCCCLFEVVITLFVGSNAEEGKG